MSTDRQQLERRIREIERENQTLRQAMANRHRLLNAGSSGTKLSVITVIGGNTLSTGQAGIKYSATPITDVPSAYDPNVTSAFIDGIGRGTLAIDGVAQAGNVLIVNDNSAGGISFALVVSDVAVVASVVTLTVGGDPNTTVSAYRLLFL